MSSAPTIMISSTFYDLRQIRTDLAAFIMNELGYVPLLSELPSFPVDPDLTTVENCRTRVERNADILVLVIGGRYGSIDSRSERSITNLEFLTARAKGIPVYTFVDQAILSMLPIWKDNPTGNFSSYVDTPRLFDFVESVHSQDRVWTFPFATAQDIIGILRVQLAYLFSDALRVRLKLSGRGLPSYFDSVSPQTLKLVLEKPSAWEYRLLFQSWIDENGRRKDLVKEYRDRLTVRFAEPVAEGEVIRWMQTRMHELEGLVTSATELMNVSARKAFGRPGEPGDAEEIIWVARMLGTILENSLEWAQRILCADVEPPFESLTKELSLSADDLIRQLQNFPIDALKQIEEAIDRAPSDGQQTLQMTMSLKLSNHESFNEKLAELGRHFKRSF
ncbi:MAG: DUF4062 domain-containing protein [Nitrospiraceae bacterium]